MRFLVLGCNGMAGHMISLYLYERGHDVTGFARKPSRFIDTIIGDAMDSSLLSKTIKEGTYDSVINCIGVLNQYAERDKAKAVYLNSFLPHFLVQLTTDMTTQVIHISTDCVFSGKKGQYTEDDERDGQSFYDRTKALGEIVDDKNLTLRQSIVGPDINPDGIGLLNWFMRQSRSVNGFSKSMWTGQTTLQLAKTIEFASGCRAHGLYNMVPDTSISKYELLKLFNHYMRNDEVLINKVDGINTDKSLRRTRFDFSYAIPDYESMIKDLADWMESHKELYITRR